MRIGIDISPLSSPHKERGSGVYVRNLIDALKTWEPSHTYTFFDKDTSNLTHVDLIHYPYFDPFFLTLPLFSAKPTAVTVHDMIPLLFPQHFPKGIRGKLKWEIQKQTLKRKQRIITDSLCSREDISRIAGIDTNIIDAIYLGPSIRLGSKHHQKDQNIIKNVPSQYFLYVGDINWNKNIEGLLRAFQNFHNHNISLVLVGKAFLDESLPENRLIHALIEKLQISKKVIKTGYVSEERLISLYSHATALIQPSYYEGFGFSVIDAFSLGCPVVCSSLSSLHEIAGPSIRVDPLDSNSITEGCNKVLNLGLDEKKHLVEKGFQWAKRFTWKKTAHETIQSYEKVLGKK